MAYRYTTFGSLSIPQVGASHEISPARPPVYLIPLQTGGAFDPQGSETPRGGAQSIQVHGVLTAATPAALATAYAAWAAALGTRATLTRVIATSGLDREETATARLVAMQAVRTPGWATLQPIDLAFAVSSACWKGAAHSVGPTALTTAPQTVTLANDGNKPVFDPVITITAAGTAITKVELAIVAVSCAIEWEGSVAAGEALVIDCGARSIKNDGDDAYSGFALASGHANRAWIELAAGNNSLVVTRTGGSTSSTVAATYNDGWA